MIVPELIKLCKDKLWSENEKFELWRFCVRIRCNSIIYESNKKVTKITNFPTKLNIENEYFSFSTFNKLP